MEHPHLIASQSDYLIQIVDRNSHTELKTVQTQIIVAKGSGSTLFTKAGHIWVQQDQG